MSNQDMVDDPELRQSLRVIERQRATKKWGVIIGIFLALGIAMLAVTLAYNDTPESAPAAK